MPLKNKTTNEALNNTLSRRLRFILIIIDTQATNYEVPPPDPAGNVRPARGGKSRSQGEA